MNHKDKLAPKDVHPLKLTHLYDPCKKHDKKHKKNINHSSDLSSAQLFDKLKWMTTIEAAFYLRVSVGQVRNMVWRQQVKAYRLHNRLRFLRSDLDALLKPSNKEATWR